MEVSGKVLNKDPVLYCHSCYRDDLYHQAYGFCKNCEEHLCENCFHYHRKPAPTRHHVLLGKEEMPAVQCLDTFRSNDDLDFCPLHANERLKYYCSEHDKFVCSICYGLDHSLVQCKVDFVPDVTVDITGSEEYRKQLEDLNFLRERCVSAIKHAEDIINKTVLNKEAISEQVEKFRQEINDALDKMEKDILVEAEEYLNRDALEVKTMSSISKEIIEEVDDIETSMSKLIDDKKLNQLFAEMKRTHKRIENMLSKGSGVWKSYGNPDIQLGCNEAFLDMLISENQIGKLLCKDNIDQNLERPLTLQYKGNIPAKSRFGNRPWFIDGLEIAPQNQLVLIGTDCRKHFVRLAELKQGLIVSEAELPSEPHSITSLSANRFAVTVKGGIQFLSVNNCMVSMEDYVVMEGQTYGIAYFDEKLIVSCREYPGKVMVLDMSGTVMMTFHAGGLLYYPKNISVSKDGNVINVTDGRHTVTQMSWQGTVLNVLRYDGCYGPRDILELLDGTSIVCYHGSNNLSRISKTGKRCQIKGLSNINVWNPHALKYCGESESIYVLCASDKDKFADSIMIFDVRFEGE